MAREITASTPRNVFPMILHQNSVQLARFLVPKNSRMEFGAFYSQCYFIITCPLPSPGLLPSTPNPPIILLTLEDSAPALPPQEAPHQGSQQAQALVLSRIHLTHYHQLLRWSPPLVMNSGQEMQLVPVVTQGFIWLRGESGYKHRIWSQI